MAKKYSVNVENDKVVSVEVDGVQYKSPDETPGAEERTKVEEMLEFGPFDPDVSLPAAESKPFPFPQIILAIFLGVAVLMFAIAAISVTGTVRRLARESSAAGQVVDLVVRKDEYGNALYYPVIEFSLPDQGRQTVQLTQGSWPAPYSIGEPVTVAYDPARPSTARIKSASGPEGMWIVPIITAVLGLAFAGATLFARWILKPSPADE